MRFAGTLALMGISIILTLILMFTGGQLRFVYLLGVSGDGIAEYSPFWLIVVQSLAAVLFLKQSFMGLAILFGMAAVLSIDIFQLFSMVDIPDASLKMQAGIIILLWTTLMSAAFSYRYFTE